MHNLKVENHVLFGRQNWALKPRTQHLGSERLHWRGKGGPQYKGLFATKTINQNIKRWLLIKENQSSQLKEFNAFLYMGDAKVRTHWNHSFDVHLSCLGSGSVLSHPESLRVLCGGGVGCSVWWLGFLFLPWAPLGLTIRPAAMWWLDGCKIVLFFFLLIRQATFFFFPEW